MFIVKRKFDDKRSRSGEEGLQTEFRDMLGQSSDPCDMPGAPLCFLHFHKVLSDFCISDCVRCAEAWSPWQPSRGSSPDAMPWGDARAMLWRYSGNAQAMLGRCETRPDS